MAEPERLSALDESFLLWEDEVAHMHVASATVFDAAPLRSADGGIDIGRIRKTIEASLDRVPRYRQRVVQLPLAGGAWWVDDPDFDIDYHLRHVSLPRPGSRDQLARFTAGIMERPLDRRRPLWEMWVVEGLEPDRFAIVTKVHHAMVDGISGVDLMMRILSTDPAAEPPEPRVRSHRRSEPPSRLRLLAAELAHRATAPLALLRGPRALRESLEDLRHEALGRTAGLVRTLARGFQPASPTLFNGPIGPHRRYAVLDQDLGEVRALARRIGCTVNDVVLATVAGAVRRTLRREGTKLRGLRFRVMAPVSVRSEEERGVLGNRVSLWIIDLPIAPSRAIARLRAIQEQTRELKHSGDALGADLLTTAAEWTSATLLALGARAAVRMRAFNLIVTNVPGPQIPLYLCGARLRETYPVAPLFDGVRMNIALLSYDGRLFWGLNADYDGIRDLAPLVADLEASFEELCREAGAEARTDAGSGAKADRQPDRQPQEGS